MKKAEQFIAICFSYNTISNTYTVCDVVGCKPMPSTIWLRNSLIDSSSATKYRVNVWFECLGRKKD